MISPRRSAQIGLGSVILVLAACVAILLNGGASKPSTEEDLTDAAPAAAIFQAADTGGSSIAHASKPAPNAPH